MEEQEDEVGVVTMESNTTSSWSAVEGTLEESVKVVEESEDAVYTAEPSSRLVLVQPSSLSSSRSSSSPADEPCELTVTFKQRHGHIHQIYVLSTARICEIYGEKEQDGGRDYVCTVRGGIIDLTEDDDVADNASYVSEDALEQGDLTTANGNSISTPLVPPAIAELSSDAEVQQNVYPCEEQSAESVTMGRVDSLQPIDEYPSLTRRDSEDDLFRSFTEATNGRAVEGSVIFEESLDHADWVECPHSPMKSASSTTDDEAEADVTKSGFYFIDADSEGHQADHPQVRLFTDEIRESDKNSTSRSLERGDTGSSGNSSWQEAIEETNLEKGLPDVTLPQGSRSEQNPEEAHKTEEAYESPRAQIDEFADHFIGESLPRSGFCDFEVNEELDSISSATTNRTPGKTVPDAHDPSTQVAETRSSETPTQNDGDFESGLPVEAPVYECEVGLVDADAWTSLTIRLLSIKAKSQVEIYRVVVTYTPGPLIQPPVTRDTGPFQQGGQASSLLAMFVPGILQMARGMSEPRIAKSSSTSSAEKGLEASKAASKATNAESSSPSPNLITAQKDILPPMKDKTLNGEVGEKTAFHSNVAETEARGTSSVKSIAHGENQFSTGYDTGRPESTLPRPVHEEGTKDGGRKEFEGVWTVNKEAGLREAHHHKDQKKDRGDELVQRLERLETICLRMEGSLNAALENMDKRLKVLESGDATRRMPPPALGQPIWGPGFDSGSFLSATSVYVPTAFTPDPGTPSLMDSQIPFSMSSTVDVPVGGEPSSTKGLSVSSTETPVYPSVLTSTSISPPCVPSALPSWPPSSWRQNVSPDSSSLSSGLTASSVSKSGPMSRSNGSFHGSEHPSNGGETYWESRTSEESESDISSDSDQTSYADNCEDPACGCCPESLSSSPTKPAQLVDNALASALSAFSASFGAPNKGVFIKEDEFYLGEEETDEEEDSFTSEEQVPLVELDSFPCYYEKEEVVPGNDAENVFVHGYEAIPVSVSDKDLTGDLSISKVVLEDPDNFWSSEIHEDNNQINWEDDRRLRTQEEKIFRALEEDPVSQTEGSAVFIQVADQSSLANSPMDDLFPADDLERDLENSPGKEAKTGDDDVEAILEAHVEDSQQNPFLQELIGGGDGNIHGAHAAWQHQQGWTVEQAEMAKNVLSSFLTIRDLSKPLDPHEEMLLQEGLFPDEWNWFTSEFSPFSSLVEVRDLAEDNPAAAAEKESSFLQTEAVDMLDGILATNIAPTAGHVEPSWSLLDDDVSIPSTTEQVGQDMYGQEWLGQKSQWSLLDEYPADLISGDTDPEYPADLISGDADPEGGFQDDNSYGMREEPRSLLDEDISLPSGKVPEMDEEANPFSADTSLEDHLNLNDGVLSSDSNHVDMSRSPSSVGSKSNPFEDEYREMMDFSQGSNKDAPLVSLEEFEEEVHEFEATEPEGTQSLLFHLSL